MRGRVDWGVVAWSDITWDGVACAARRRPVPVMPSPDRVSSATANGADADDIGSACVADAASGRHAWGGTLSHMVVQPRFRSAPRGRGHQQFTRTEQCVHAQGDWDAAAAPRQEGVLRPDGIPCDVSALQGLVHTQIEGTHSGGRAWRPAVAGSCADQRHNHHECDAACRNERIRQPLVTQIRTIRHYQVPSGPSGPIRVSYPPPI